MVNNYKVKMKSDAFFTINEQIIVYNAYLEYDEIIFETNTSSVKVLDESKLAYEIVESIKENVKKTLSIKRGYIIGLAFLVFLIFINTYRIGKIVFNGDFPINDEITKMIEGQYKQIGPFNFYGGDLEKLNREVRSRFVTYEWISIEKQGLVMNVTINRPPQTDKIEDDDNLVGDIIATKMGIIKFYQVYNGKPIIEYNKFVMPGDVLISGNLLATTDHQEPDYVKAKGLVLATTFTEEKIVVLKESTTLELTGKMIDTTQINLFGLKMNFKKNPYVQFDVVEVVKFNLFGFFQIKKLVYLEKSDIINTYTLEEAKEYAISIIHRDFNRSKIDKREMIESINLLEVVETAGQFEINYLVRRLENIGSFKEKMDEATNKN